MPTFPIEVEFNVFCADCGGRLDADVRVTEKGQRAENPEIIVYACKRCLDDAKEGYKDGYKDGNV